jgi:hypothetical protein
MKPVVLAGLFALVVVAVPVAIEIGEENHLEKRGGTDTVIADVVKALIAFGAFIWGGGIIAKRAVNYYFEKREKYDREHPKTNLMAGARIRNTATKVESHASNPTLAEKISDEEQV